MAVVETRTFPPFFAQPPHLRDPSGEVYVWHTDPPGIVLQLMTHKGTAEMAKWLAGPSRDALDRRFPNGEDLLVVFDVRSLTTREPAARATIIELAKGLKPRVKQVIVLPPRAFGPVAHSTMQVTLSLLRMFGVNIELAQSPTFVIGSQHLRPL
jgi:hypothetical protein